MNENTRDAVQTAMQALYNRNNGEVTASLVLKAATNKRSALHCKFEWDDTKAGNEYRLEQARRLIRVVLIYEDEKPTRLIHVPSIERIESSEGVYKAASVIIQSKTDFQLALEAALTRLQSAQRAVDDLRSAAADDDTLSKIMLAYEALSTANNALSSVH